MGARDVVARTARTVLRAVEGAFRQGPYFLPVSGGWLPDGVPTNFWQLGIDPLGDLSRSAMVEACVSAYAQTVAMCPGDHWRINSKGGRDRITTSALARMLRRPNLYQSISDFLLNAVRSLYLEGNAYALALRNNRFEVSELHLMNPRLCAPQIAEDGEVFYTLGGNDVITRQLKNQPLVVPQRDVLHIRLHCDRRHPYPLIGQSPIIAALMDVGVGDAIAQQQMQFYVNQARPSAVLSTDMVLDKDQVQALRDRWNEQTRGLNQGQTPILTAGLKVQPWVSSGRDAQVAEMAKLSSDRIALAFRVPLQVLGLAGGPSYGSAETLMQFWIATGLGFCLNHVEEAFGVLFDLRGQPEEYVEFDTAALLRSAHKDRIEALARGVMAGVYSPNEARNLEGLDKVKAGEEPRVQQQVVPLSAAEKIDEPKPSTAGPQTPPAPPAPGPEGAPPAPPPQKDYSDATRAEVQRIIATIGRSNQRFG